MSLFPLNSLASKALGARTQGKMTRAAALFLLLLPAACAETQSGRAFLPRPAAEAEIPVVTPNRSAERNRDLADSLDRSLEAQEERESGPLQEMAGASAPNYPAPERADRAPVASFR